MLALSKQIGFEAVVVPWQQLTSLSPGAGNTTKGARRPFLPKGNPAAATRELHPFASPSLITVAMAVITDLPCEVVATVLRNLGDIPSFSASLITCRYIYTSFQQNPSLGADILQEQIGTDLLPFAAAALEASHLNLHTEAVVHELLETLYTEPHRLTALLRTMPISFLARIGHLHEVIHGLTSKFASNALTQLVDEPPTAAGPPPLSPSEHFRFCRAFYRAELYFRLFRREFGVGILSVTENEKAWFFSRHPPWENEQLSCAYDFLELTFAKG